MTIVLSVLLVFVFLGLFTFLSLFDDGHSLHTRHLIEGKISSEHEVCVFDYGLVNNQGAFSQTVFTCSCPLPEIGRFALCKKAWLGTDSLWALASETPVKLWQLLTPGVCAWLLEHQHLHIEWSNGILLLCRPQQALS